MIGDQQDMLTRLQSVLPTRWFPDDAPILDGLLNGLAWCWSWTYELHAYVVAQTRIATATDVWLDVIAQDYFGTRLMRRAGQSDNQFRDRIDRELFRERGTRSALVSTLHDLTGRVPILFEPGQTMDTGSYGSLTGSGGGLGYGIAGGWGNLDLPFQCFITAYRSLGNGIALVSGWGNPVGAYGTGAIQYASLSMVQGQITDDDIYTAIAEVLPIACVGWTKITN